MTFSLFDLFIVRLRRPLVPPPEFAGLTPEEIRELQRMRAEVKRVRAQVQACVSENRMGAI